MLIKDIFSTSKSIFRIDEFNSFDELESIVQPIEGTVVPVAEAEFIVKSIQVFGDKEIDCFMSVCLPERLRGTVYRLANGQIISDDPVQADSTIIPQVGFEMYGDYTLFYAEQNPLVSVRTLKNLMHCNPNVAAIAVDLGYILRDADDVAGALEAFHRAENIGLSSEYIYLELSRLYKRLRMSKEEEHYKKLFESGL